MPTISIGNNPKKINSTSRAFTVSATLSCRLKEPCSMQAPVFRVQGLTKGALYNYCQFESRYYWIDDIIYLTHSIQEVHCHLDPLATFKTDIGNTYAYIEYGDAAHWAREIDDNRFSPEEEVSKGIGQEVNMFSRIFNVDYDDVPVTPSLRANASVVFSVMNGGGTTPGVKYYCCSVIDFYAIVVSLTNAIDPASVQSGATWSDYEFAQYIQMIISSICGQGSWVDNLISCVMLPINYSAFYAARSDIATSPVTRIWFGGVECDVSAIDVRQMSTVNNVIWGNYKVAIPWSSVSGHANDGGVQFMRNARWVSIQVNCGGEYHNLDASWLRNQDTLYVYWSLDTTTGAWDLRVCEGGAKVQLTDRDDLSQTLTQFNGCIGTDIKNLVGTGLSNTSSVVNIATGLISNLIRTIPATVQDSTSSNRGEATSDDSDESDNEPTSSTMGSILSAASGVFGAFPASHISASSPSGGGSGNTTALFLTSTAGMGKLFIAVKQWVFHNYGWYGYGDPGAFPNCFCDEYGYPVHSYGKIGDYSGYVKCVGASVKGSRGATNNLSTINNFLNTGFYYE